MTIDELDLAFDEHAERGRPRHRRPRRTSGGGGGAGKSLIALLMAFVLLGALAGGAWYGFDKVSSLFSTPDYPGPGSGEAIVEIAKGATATDMANALVAQDVVKSAGAFVQAAKDNPRSKNIQDGSYKLRKQMAAKDAVTFLLDTKNRVVRGVTIPEGLSYQQTFQKLSEATKIPVAEFQAAAKDPVALGVPEFWFKRSDGKKVVRSIEGFLYPETYEFPPKADAKLILSTMVEHFNNVMAELDFPDRVQKERQISPYEALIAASIAQAEALLDKDMGPVVRVLYNRAYTEKFPCKCLGLDSTVNYWLRLTGKKGKGSEDLTEAELHNPKNPYNTHDFPGMPVGPIGNPGLSAIKGAMSPPPSNDMYFISIDLKGTMAYAEDWDGHQANIRVACKNGIPLC